MRDTDVEDVDGTRQDEPRLTLMEMIEQYRVDVPIGDLEAVIREAEEELADEFMKEMQRANADYWLDPSELKAEIQAEIANRPPDLGAYDRSNE